MRFMTQTGATYTIQPISIFARLNRSLNAADVMGVWREKEFEGVLKAMPTVTIGERCNMHCNPRLTGFHGRIITTSPVTKILDSIN